MMLRGAGYVSSFAALLLGLATSSCATDGAVRAGVAVSVHSAPPPLRYEVRVARPSPRHVWVSGHWDLRGGRYVWVSGRWVVPPRAGAVWVKPRYQRRGGGFVYVRGYWRS
jgi:hypothetical protein